MNCKPSFPLVQFNISDSVIAILILLIIVFIRKRIMAISATNLHSLSFPTSDAISTSQFPSQTVVFNFRISGHSKNVQFSIYSMGNTNTPLKCDSNDSQLFKLKCSKSSEVVKNEVAGQVEPTLDSGSGGDDGNDRLSSGGGGAGGSGGDDGNGDGDEEEFGPIMRFDDVMKEAEMQGAQLPPDMVEAAQSDGIRSLILTRYIELQGSVWPLGFLMRYCPMLRNRMLADPSFLFKVGTEVVIDTCCATFAEVQKRGKDFWSEFELYAADVLVGVVVDIALVGLLAPYVRIGKQSVSSGTFGRLRHACSSLPSSVFEVERPGSRFSLQQRVATYFYKGVLYGSVGFGCGLIGQGIANLIMTAKRSMNKSEKDIPIPPLVKSAVLWGVFLAVSSNTRYQIINGLEGIVERSPAAKGAPLVAMAFTVGVRFANNIYGGMQFVDWAKLSGVQ